MAEAMKYFSTKFTVQMMGARFIPSVCYKLDEIIAPTVAKLAEAGEARTYPEKVRFVNGVPIPVKKPETIQTSSEVKKSPAAAGTGKRGGKKDFE